MAFRFSMQKVLDYREQLEEEAKVRLAEARRCHQEAVRRLETLETIMHNAQEKAREFLLKDAAERWLHEGYVKGLSADVKEASRQAQKAGQEVDEARRLLATRAVDKKILNKLKARHAQQFQQEEQRKEQYTNDETATLRYKAPAF